VQTGHAFKTRLKEHTRAIWFNKDNSRFANRILNIMHSYGTIEETMEILKASKKSWYLDTLEKYFIFQYNQNRDQLNEMHTSTYNPIFNTLYQYYHSPTTTST
jgi:hypothetical protein